MDIHRGGGTLDDDCLADHLARWYLLEMLETQRVEVGDGLNLVGLEGVDEAPAVVVVGV